jgi:hypothetical protein
MLRAASPGPAGMHGRADALRNGFDRGWPQSGLRQQVH